MKLTVTFENRPLTITLTPVAARALAEFLYTSDAADEGWGRELV